MSVAGKAWFEIRDVEGGTVGAGYVMRENLWQVVDVFVWDPASAEITLRRATRDGEVIV